jgi:hypothetical protein
MSVRAVISEFERLGRVVEPSSPEDKAINGYYVYMIYNGEDIVQIGHGRDHRMTKCMRDSLAQKHSKAFICAMLEQLKGGSRNKYCLVHVKSKQEAELHETRIHSGLGIRTNEDGATIIQGIPGTSIEQIHAEIWEKYKDLPIYLKLTPQEKVMAEELFDVVTHATIKIRRTSGAVINSNQGDNLEGNILMNVNRGYLTNIFQRLSNSYLRYGKHKWSESEYQKLLQSYSYEPKRKKHTITNF